MIKGKEITLRHAQATELDTLIDLINNPDFKGEFSRTLLKLPSTLKKEFESNGFSTEASEMFTIVNKANKLIRTIGHFNTVHYSSAREPGFSVFGQESTNKGVATEAVKILTRYLFENFQLNRIQFACR